MYKVAEKILIKDIEWILGETASGDELLVSKEDLLKSLNIIKDDYVSYLGLINNKDVFGEISENEKVWADKLRGKLNEILPLVSEEKYFFSMFRRIETSKEIKKEKYKELRERPESFPRDREYFSYKIKSVFEELELIQSLLQGYRNESPAYLDKFLQKNNIKEDNTEVLFRGLPSFNSVAELDASIIADTLCALYSYSFGKKVGLTRPSKKGGRYGKGIRFIKSCIQLIGITKAESTIYELIKKKKEENSLGYISRRV